MLRLSPGLLLLLLLPAPLAAQASPYVPLDDPRLPALEHLIRRGDVDDPSPMVRPFRRADAVRMLNSALARGTVGDTALAGLLRRGWSEDTAEARWEVGVRAGFQAQTEARRDPLHPAGDGGINPYLDLHLQATFGSVVLVSRPAIEPRLTDDPDWPGRKDLTITGRHAEAYVSAQFKWVRLFYGEMDREWRPQEFPGIGISALGYPRPDFGFEVGNDKFGLTSHASTLRDVTDSAGTVIHRYFFAHRIRARVSPRLTFGLWETVLLAGEDRSFDARYRNPVTLLLLGNQYGLGDEGNIMLGLDLQWRFAGATTLTAQAGLDDLQYEDHPDSARTPNRYAFSIAVRGPLGTRLAWWAGYSQASSLVYRTSYPYETFTEADVGLGRTFGDNDQVTIGVSAPVTRHWIVLPELTLLRQGEGLLTDPWPQGAALGDTPTVLSGTVERTWRAAVGLSGQQGPLAVIGNFGVHFVDNADHVAGRQETRLAARVQATLGLTRGGHF